MNRLALFTPFCPLPAPEHRSRPLALAIAMAAALPAQGIEEVTVTEKQTADRYLERSAQSAGFAAVDLREVPQSVQVLTGDFIKDTGFLSVTELLNTVPGASPSFGRSTPFSTSVAQIRGQEAVIYRDGLRDIDYSDIDTSALINIEKIEVLKGPAGIVYGTGGPGGIVNIITKKPEAERSATLQATIGTRNTRIFAGDVNMPIIDGLAVRMTGEVERSDSFIDFSEISRSNLSATIGYEPTSWLRTSLAFERMSNRDRDAMTRIGLPAAGTILPAAGIDVDRGTYLGEPSFDFRDSYGNMTTFRAELDLAEDVTFEASLRRINVTFEQAETARNIGPLDLATATVPRDGARQLIVDVDNWLARSLIKAGFDTGAFGHQFTAGYEFFESDLLIDFDSPGAATPQNVLTPTYDPTFGSSVFDIFLITQRDSYHEAFFQDVISYGDFTLTGGMRYVDARFESNTDSLSTVTYQVGGTWRTTDTLSLFAGYNTGFEANAGLATSRSRTGERFDPETFAQIEAGVKTELLAGVSGTFSVFRIVRENTLVTDPLDAGFDIQTGKERSQGFETDLLWQATDGLALRFGYAFLDTEIVEDTDPTREGNERALAPQHQVSGFANYTFLTGPLTGLRLTGGVAHLDDAFTSVSNDVVQPAYTLVNFGASYRYRRYRFDFNVTNLLDEEYFVARNDIQVYPGEPRLFMLRASAEF